MNAVGLIGGAVLCAATAMVLRECKSGFAVWPVLLGGVLLLAKVFVSLTPIGTFFTLFADMGLSAQVSLIGKVLGIGYLSEIGAELCREFGAPSLSARVEFCGRVEILLLCLPVLKEILDKAMEMLA